jgi:hypothetical protein
MATDGSVLNLSGRSCIFAENHSGTSQSEQRAGPESLYGDIGGLLPDAAMKSLVPGAEHDEKGPPEPLRGIQSQLESTQRVHL